MRKFVNGESAIAMPSAITDDGTTGPRRTIFDKRTTNYELRI
jgi:hypothetical protein